MIALIAPRKSDALFELCHVGLTCPCLYICSCGSEII